jgi:hypothetical protein
MQPPEPTSVGSAFGAGAVSRVVYQGGPVIGAVRVLPIYWGAAWSTAENTQLAAQLDGFLTFLVTSTLMDMLAEYSTAARPISRGARLASVRIPGSEPGDGAVVTDAQVQQALVDWAANGAIAAPTPNTLYFLYLPPGVVSVDQNGLSSCAQMCSYHGALGTIGYYAVIPYLNCPACMVPSGLFDTLTMCSSHEFCEAVTDPRLDGWKDPTNNNEIADLCQNQTARINGFLLQAAWSNAQGACAFSPLPRAT